MNIKESIFKKPLQDLLDHTTKIIFKIPLIHNISANANLKWYTSGQSQYKQKFNDESTSTPTITNLTMFMSSDVPFELRSFLDLDKNDYDVIWQNPMRSYTKFTCSIKFLCKKQTSQSTKEELKDIEE